MGSLALGPALQGAQGEDLLIENTRVACVRPGTRPLPVMPVSVHGQVMHLPRRKLTGLSGNDSVRYYVSEGQGCGCFGLVGLEQVGAGPCGSPSNRARWRHPGAVRTAAQMRIPVHTRAAHGPAGSTLAASPATLDLAVTLNPGAGRGSHTREGTTEPRFCGNNEGVGRPAWRPPSLDCGPFGEVPGARESRPPSAAAALPTAWSVRLVP